MNHDFTAPFGFDPEGHPDKIRAADLTNRFINRYVANDQSKGKWRVIGGPVGTGKTMLAKVVLRCALSQTLMPEIRASRKATHTPEAHMLKWVELGSDEHSEKDFAERLENFVRGATLVVIDDIGAESDRYKSGVSRNRLLRVLEVCEKKWLFATTNLKPDEYETRYDERVGSRLRGAVSVWIDAPDYRQKKKEVK